MAYDKKSFLMGLAAGLATRGVPGNGHGSPPIPTEPFLTFSSQNAFTLVYNPNAANRWNGILQYSVDAITWNTWDGTTIASGSTNKLYLRGFENTIITGSGTVSPTRTRFIFNGSNIECEGNIEVLLDCSKVANGEHPAMDSHCFFEMFRDSNAIVKGPDLLSVNTAYRCYTNMYYGSTSLRHAPIIAAEKMEEYACNSMFRNCTNLESLPKLYATNYQRYSCNGMFNGCTKIKISETQMGEYVTVYRIPTTGTGTNVSDNDFTGMFSNTGGTFQSKPTINTTYYTSNQVV